MNIENRFIEVKIAQRSDEWKEFRKGKIGASQVASVLGINPYQTQLQVWEEIIFGCSKPANEDMKRGIKLEADALKLWNEMHMDFSQHKPIVAQSKTYPDLIASLDGWNGDYLIEIKCPRKFSGEVPRIYYPQLQHQMFVTSTEMARYVEYVNGKIQSYCVERDEEFIQMMVSKELAFLSSIIDFNPPKPSDEDWVSENDPERLARAHRYKELSFLIDELETEREDIRKEFIEDAKHPRIRCGEIKIQKVVCKGRIDNENLYAHFELSTGESIEKFRKKPTEVWKINIF